MLGCHPCDIKYHYVLFYNIIYEYMGMSLRLWFEHLDFPAYFYALFDINKDLFLIKYRFKDE